MLFPVCDKRISKVAPQVAATTLLVMANLDKDAGTGDGNIFEGPEVNPTPGMAYELDASNSQQHVGSLQNSGNYP